MTVEHPAAPLVVVTPWRRYGHQRAYVKIDERDVGYRDLLSGAVHCPDPQHAQVITRATDELYERAAATRRPGYAARHAAPEPAETPAAARPAKTTVRPRLQAQDLLPDRDVALHRPGQAAREKALELKGEAPVHTFLSRIVGRKTPERAWRIGADGEDLVADRLARLDSAWTVLHAIPVGERGADIDHVVIGPGGVFTINAKNHPRATVWACGDTVLVNGAKTSYVRNSRHEAARAATLLSAAAGFEVRVHGIIAVVGAHRGLTVKEQPRDGQVLITARRQLTALLRGRPAVLDVAAVTRIVDVARHLSTWQPTTVSYQPFETA